MINQVLALDRHKNVAGLIQLMGFQPPFIIGSPTTIDININFVQDKYAEFDFIVIAHCNNIP